jgi:hypothetical protein
MKSVGSSSFRSGKMLVEEGGDLGVGVEAIL